MDTECAPESFYTIFNFIKQGAEARLYRGTYMGKNVIVKERFVKKYRHPKLDEMLTRERMKAEARALLRCRSAGVCCPTVYLVDLDRRILVMEDVSNSATAKLFMEQLTTDQGEAFGVDTDCSVRDWKEGKEKTREVLGRLADTMGESVGRLHSEGVIHGDLTTSNFLVPLSQGQFKGICLIDFGLSQSSASPEDKAVDLYVLERALLSTHRDSEWIFSRILKAYLQVCPKGAGVVKKLEEVRARGRKRTMIG